MEIRSVLQREWIKQLGAVEGVKWDLLPSQRGSVLEDFMRRRNINQEFINREEHHESLAEIVIKILKRTMRKLLDEYPMMDSEEACCLVSEIHNSLPSAKSTSSPWERLSGYRAVRLPDLTNGNNPFGLSLLSEEGEGAAQRRHAARLAYQQTICDRKIIRALRAQIRERGMAEDIEIGSRVRYLESGKSGSWAVGNLGAIVRDADSKIVSMKIVKANQKITHCSPYHVFAQEK